MPNKPPEWWTPKIPYYENLWNHLLDKAKKDKEWAEEKKDDKDWINMACGVSKEMLKNRLESTAEELALYSYKYLYFRAHATGEAWGSPMPIDQPAKEQWEELTGEVIS